MVNYTENDMQNAIKDVQAGMSSRKAAILHGVPRSTLGDRIGGTPNRADSHEAQQKLSREQEGHLRDWVKVQEALGFPPTQAQLAEFAHRIAKKNGYPEPLGLHWVEGFLRRNPEVRTLRSQRLDIVRFNGATTKRIKAFFRLHELPQIKGIKRKNRHNMDEFGVMEGQGHNGLVLGSSHKKVILMKNPGSRSWITIIECISADGRLLTPLVIFKGKSVQQQWFPEELAFLNDWNFTATETGWTDNKIALTWLRDIFIPETRPEKPDEKRLLILDGHGSHATADFMFECYRNGIYLLFLPSHSSHVTQPLDVAVFGPVKNAYRREVSKLAGLADTTLLGKITFLRCYEKARKKGITYQNIIAGWKTSGQWPVSIAKPLMNSMTTEDETTDTRPKTPPENTKNTSETLFETPRSSAQLRKGLEDVLSSSQLDRTVRHFLVKIGKGLDSQNAILASQDRELMLLRHENEELRPKKRKKVPVDQNERFAKVPDVLRARESMYRLLNPQGTSKRVKTRNDVPREVVWQLEIPEMQELGLTSLEL
ncbi:hypothetical protein ACJ41O_013346 [Fusarium nematophilum]